MSFPALFPSTPGRIFLCPRDDLLLEEAAGDAVGGGAVGEVVDIAGLEEAVHYASFRDIKLLEIAGVRLDVLTFATNAREKG